VICLVRAGDAAGAWQRLHSAVSGRIEIPTASWQRVRLVLGDLARPNMGLASATWEELASRVDTVYHCAARVHNVLGYTDLRADNVLGTAEVAHLAGSGRPKRLHHASTLSVFVATDANTGRLMERDCLQSMRWVHGGYAQSKWAAEWLLRRCAPRIGSLKHYRIGLITGDSRGGRSARGDFLTLFIAGLTRLGCLPPIDRASLALDVTPIDFAAAALAHLSLHVENADTFHLANPRSLTLEEIVAALAEKGIRIAEVAVPHWHDRLRELQRDAPAAAAACLALCRGLPGEAAFDRYRTMDLFQSTDVVFDMRQALAGLSGTGISCPPPVPDLVRKYVAAALSTPANHGSRSEP
jgi:thioester reductase-like protein